MRDWATLVPFVILVWRCCTIQKGYFFCKCVLDIFPIARYNWFSRLMSYIHHSHCCPYLDKGSSRSHLPQINENTSFISMFSWKYLFCLLAAVTSFVNEWVPHIGICLNPIRIDTSFHLIVVSFSATFALFFPCNILISSKFMKSS